MIDNARSARRVSCSGRRRERKSLGDERSSCRFVSRAVVVVVACSVVVVVVAVTQLSGVERIAGDDTVVFLGRSERVARENERTSGGGSSGGGRESSKQALRTSLGFPTLRLCLCPVDRRKCEGLSRVVTLLLWLLSRSSSSSSLSSLSPLSSSSVATIMM